MKKFLVLTTLALALCNCGQSQQQQKAVALSKQIQSVIKPGTIATSATGYQMRAKINGKDWQAASMVSPGSAGRIVGYFEKDYIGLPYSKQDLKPGRKIRLGEDEAADLSLNDGCLWTHTTGEIEIIKADGHVADGRFFFSATCGGKQVKVSDGYFRIIY